MQIYSRIETSTLVFFGRMLCTQSVAQVGRKCSSANCNDQSTGFVCNRILYFFTYFWISFLNRLYEPYDVKVTEFYFAYLTHSSGKMNIASLCLMKIRSLNDNSATITIHILILLARIIYVLQYTSMYIPIRRNYNIVLRVQFYQFYIQLLQCVSRN